MSALLPFVLNSQPSGGGGGGGSATLPVANTLFVDLGGDDLTGTKGRFDKPYATFMAAYNAASTGDVIELRPGTHSIPSGTETLNKAITIHITDGATLSHVNTSSRSTVLFGGSGLATGWTMNIVGRGTLAVSSTASWSTSAFPATVMGCTDGTSGNARINIDLGTLQLGPFAATNLTLAGVMATTGGYNIDTMGQPNFVRVQRLLVDTSNQTNYFPIFKANYGSVYNITTHRRIAGPACDALFSLAWGVASVAEVGNTNANSLFASTDHAGTFRLRVGSLGSSAPPNLAAIYSGSTAGNYDIQVDMCGNALNGLFYSARGTLGRLRVLNAKIPALTLNDAGVASATAGYTFQNCDFTGSLTIPSGSTNKTLHFDNCLFLVGSGNPAFVNNTGSTFNVNVYGLLASDGGILGTNMAVRGGSFASDAGFTKRIN